MNLDGLDEEFEAVTVEWDGWEDDEYVRKIKTIGVIKRWVLHCHENNVTWDNSAAKDFEAKCKSGDTVVLVIDFGTIDSGSLHEVTSTNVRILRVKPSYGSGKTRRKFSVTVQAV